jgi:hypothetical protein
MGSRAKTLDPFFLKGKIMTKSLDRLTELVAREAQLTKALSKTSRRVAKARAKFNRVIGNKSATDSIDEIFYGNGSWKFYGREGGVPSSQEYVYGREGGVPSSQERDMLKYFRGVTDAQRKHQLSYMKNRYMVRGGN